MKLPLFVLFATLTVLAWPTAIHADSWFVRGDCNADGFVDVSDAVFELEYLFLGGATPPCSDSCDIDDDGSLNLIDAVAALLYLLGSGPAPLPPFPDCGPDPTPTDPFDCAGPLPGCPIVGSAPQISSTPVTIAEVGSAYSYDVEADDPDLGETLEHSLVLAPADASIDALTGLIEWTPSVEGDHAFTVRVTDPVDLFAEQEFVVTVSDPNDPPIVTNDTYSVAPGCERQVPASAGVMSNDLDPDGDPLNVTVTVPPTHGTLVLFPDGAFEYAHDGSTDPVDAFTYEASDGTLTTEGVVTLLIEDAPRRWLDHFAASLDSDRWSTGTTGAGQVALPGDSIVRFDSPSPTDSAFLRTSTPLDATRSQLWLFCIRAVAAAEIPDLIGLWKLPSGTPPVASTSAALDSQRLGSIGFDSTGPDWSIIFRHDLDAAGPRYWDGAPADQWGTAGNVEAAVGPIRTGPDADWTVVGMEYDAEALRFRWLSMHRIGTSIGDPSQGVSLNALSDWVALSPGDVADELWITIGDRNSSLHAGLFEAEWIRLEAEEGLHGYTNARGSIATEYTLRRHRNRGTQFVPVGRETVMLGGGPTGSWNDHGIRKKNVIHGSDGLYYLFYEGFDPNDASAIGVATSDSPEGPWAPHPANPVLPRTILPGGGATYDVLTAPFVVEDLGESDPNRRWKILACGEVVGTATHRMFLFTAPTAEGPWLHEPGPSIDGAVLAESQLGDWRDDGVCDPLVWWDADSQLWNLYFSGIREKDTEYGPGGWSVGHATSTDLLVWTENPGNPVMAADPLGVRSWSAVNGTTLTVSDPNSFTVDAAVIIRNGSTLDGWGISRIRSINGNQLELYHEIVGVGGSASHRTVAQIGNGSLSPMVLVQETHGCYRMYLTVFQPFILGAASAGFGNCELVATMTAPSPEGPWTWDHLGSPCVPLTVWGATRAQENPRTVLFPTER